MGLRAWLEGQEVVLARKACALNADGGTTKRTPYRTAFFTERNRWINIFTFFSALTLLRLLPLLATEAAARIFWRSNRLAKIHAWVWLAFHPRELYRKRRKVQARRKVQDADILEKISGSYLSVDSRSGRFVNSFWRFIFRLFLIPLGP